MTFDVQGYCESRELEYWTGGKNVTKGWTNITCPLCGDHYYSGNNHCGISPHGKFNCWICLESGNVLTLIKEIENCTWGVAKAIYEKFSDEGDIHFEEEIKRKKKVIFPKEAIEIFPKLHLNYLKSRGYDPDLVIKKYNLKACSVIGDWKQRIIIPVFYKNILQTYVGADVTRKSHIKYKDCPREESIAWPKECLYNIDLAKDTIILVEGILDAWRIGDGACCMFSKNLSKKQILQIIEKKIKKVFVLLDSDARELNEKIANKLSGIVPHVEVIDLDEGDPDELPQEDIQYLRSLLI